MKVYPLRIEMTTETSNDPGGLFSRGHHDAAAFVAAITAEYGGLDGMTGQVETGYWRWVPCAPGGDVDMRCIETRQPTRGAFPVTYMRGMWA